MSTSINTVIDIIKSSIQYTLVNSIQEIEETTQDLKKFVKKATEESSVNNTDKIASHRISPIEKLYHEGMPNLFYYKETFRILLIKQVKKTLKNLQPLTPEEKKRQILIKGLSHNTLIRCLQTLYPNRPDHGICHGFALMGLQSILTGMVEQFSARLEKLAVLIMGHPVDRNISEVVEEIQRRQDFELLAFFEGLEMGSRGHLYHHLFTDRTRPYSQLNEKFINSTLSIIGSREFEDVAIVETASEDNSLEVSKKILEIDHTSGAYSHSQLSEYFYSLQAVLERSNLPDAPIAMLIKNLKHSCVIGYDPGKKIWTYIDANIVFPLKTPNIDQLVSSVLIGLNPDRETYTHLHSSVFSTKNEGARWTEIFNEWKKTRAFAKLHRVQRNYHKKNIANLLIASRYNDVQSAARLIGKTKLDDTIPSLPTNPLATAAVQGHLEMASALIEAGSDVDAVDKDGKTALFHACQMGHADMVRILLEANADVNKKDKSGEIPYIKAFKNRHLPVLEVLENHISKKRKRTIDNVGEES